MRIERIKNLNNLSLNENGAYVLYWMQQSQRHVDNHALEYAIAEANHLQKPILVAFALDPSYPDANIRHYSFMLEGLKETVRGLRRRGLDFCLRLGEPTAVVAELAKESCLTVCDRGYLRHQREWRRKLADAAGCRMIQIEADAIVPVDTASNKQEYAARTIRPKLMGQYEYFLDDCETSKVETTAAANSLPPGEDIDDVPGLLKRLACDSSVAPVELFPSGPDAARRVFRDFLETKLVNYEKNRNQPQTDDVSHMSKYLHFGQVSPGWLVREVRRHEHEHPESVGSFIEELLVRRELALNHTNFSDDYDSFDGLPDWAVATLDEHENDTRPHIYDEPQLENAETHDPYWNAAMNEMRYTGYMHNYMRMYWGKKILEWSPTPRRAFDIALKLNNRYFIDGRDPNSYTGVAWVFGRHDRPWKEREIYGQIRCMTASGLERKCEIDKYVKKVSLIIGLRHGGS